MTKTGYDFTLDGGARVWFMDLSEHDQAMVSDGLRAYGRLLQQLGYTDVVVDAKGPDQNLRFKPGDHDTVKAKAMAGAMQTQLAWGGGR
jgi:hypothetical protein